MIDTPARVAATRRGWMDVAVITLIAGVGAGVPYILKSVLLPITRDSGVFLYAGRVILSGGAPYVDVWDHKGPVLYLFNAAGMALFHGNAGAYILEGVLLFLSVMFTMMIWRPLVDRAWLYIAGAGTILTYYAVYELGNFSETWLFPFQLASLALVLRVVMHPGASRWYLAACAMVGVTLAVAVLTRVNNAAGLLVLAAVLVIHGVRRKHVGWILLLAASGTIMAAVLLWLELHGALPDFYEQYVEYNLFYADGSDSFVRWNAAARLAETLLVTPLGILSLIIFGWWMYRPERYWCGAHRPFHLMILVLAADFSAQLVSGREYSHYLVVCVPGLAGTLIAMLRKRPPADHVPVWSVRAAWPWILCGVLLILPLRKVMEGNMSYMRSYTIKGTQRQEIIGTVQRHTAAADRVLVHGAETWILAASGRWSSTRLTYVFPVRQKFGSAEDEYLASLRHAPPTLIVIPEWHAQKHGVDTVQTVLFSILDREYELIRETGGYRFYRRLLH